MLIKLAFYITRQMIPQVFLLTFIFLNPRENQATVCVDLKRGWWKENTRYQEAMSNIFRGNGCQGRSGKQNKLS